MESSCSSMRLRSVSRACCVERSTRGKVDGVADAGALPEGLDGPPGIGGAVSIGPMLSALQPFRFRCDVGEALAAALVDALVDLCAGR